MKKTVCVIIILFMSAGISAANQPTPQPTQQHIGPKQGDYELVRIENRSQFYVETSCFGYSVCLQPGGITVVRRNPSYGLGEFYFVASAYAINSEGLREFVSQQTFYFHLDGNTQPYYNGQNYEYFGAIVPMSYFPVLMSYNSPASNRRVTLGPLSFIINVDFWGSYPRRNYYPRTYITQEVIVWRGRGNYQPHRDNHRKGAEYYNRGYYDQKNSRRWRN